MDKKSTLLKRINYYKVGWWTAICSDVVYLICAIWCVTRYFEPVSQETYQLSMDIYMIECQQSFFPFFIGYFLLLMSRVFLYTDYISNKLGKLKKIMIACVIMQLIGILFWGLLYVMGDFGGMLLYFPGMIVLCLAGIAMIVEFILFVIDKTYRKLEFLLIASFFFHCFGLYILVLVACYFVYKLLMWFFFPPKELHIVEERDLDGNIIDRWTIER